MFGIPTYSALGYTPQASPSDDVYSLAEEGALFLKDEKIVPKPMRYRDIFSVHDTMEKSIADDPLDKYMTETPDGHKNTKLWKAGRLATLLVPLIANIYHRRMWTVNHGESMIAIIDPTAKAPRGSDALDKLVINLITKLRYLTESPEQRARSSEFGTKFRDAVQKVLGEEVETMVEVASLATRPDRQSHGYASALVRLATRRADASGRRSYLGSSNVINRGFYASLGFEIVYTMEIGKENPNWDGKPIEVDLMVREPKVARPQPVNSEKGEERVEDEKALILFD